MQERRKKEEKYSNKWIKRQSEREQKLNQMVESMMQLGSPHSTVLRSRRHEELRESDAIRDRKKGISS